MCSMICLCSTRATEFSEQRNADQLLYMTSGYSPLSLGKPLWAEVESCIAIVGGTKPGGTRVWDSSSRAHKQLDGMPLHPAPPCTSPTYSPDDSSNTRDNSSPAT
ncbi:unnamed protein product [Urochloa humidicola]